MKNNLGRAAIEVGFIVFFYANLLMGEFGEILAGAAGHPSVRLGSTWQKRNGL